MQAKKYLFWNVFLPLLLGAVLYYIYCPQVMFVRGIDRMFGWENHRLISSMYPLRGFVRNYLFDFLWAYAFASCVTVITDNRIIRLAIPITALVLFESMQLIWPNFGTFDVWDIVVEILAVITCALIYRLRIMMQ